MTDELTPPDTEGLVKAWLLTVPSVTAIVSTRVWFGADRPTEASYPHVTLARIGGALDVGVVDAALLQVDAWGNRTKASAWSLAAALVGAFTSLDATPATINGWRLHARGPTSYAWLPDGEAKVPRYSITQAVSVVPA